MADTILTITNPEFAAITFNAVLLLGMGLAMAFAKQLESLRSRLLGKNRPIMFHHSAAFRLSAFSFRGHS